MTNVFKKLSKLLLKLALGLTLFLFAFIVCCYFYVKITVGNHAKAGERNYNDNHRCYAVTYFTNPNYDEPDPLPLTLRRLYYTFGSPTFYRVYSSDGKLLRTTEWHIFETTTDLDHLRWIGVNNILYPADGYQRWRIPECGNQ